MPSFFWNGEVTDAFLSSPRVKQGYPLFITIYIYFLERLAHDLTVRQGL